MAECISDGIINCLIVTSSAEANVQLTRIHEHLFARKLSHPSLIFSPILYSRCLSPWCYRVSTPFPPSPSFRISSIYLYSKTSNHQSFHSSKSARAHDETLKTFPFGNFRFTQEIRP
jgi:hypothetical protein